MISWHDLIIPPSASIRDAMRAIDIGSVKTAFVVQGDNLLLGAVTDGDIRRGLLSTSDMDDPVTSIMNKNPATCDKNATKEEIKKALDKYDVFCIPIVDERRIVKVETLKTVSKYEKRDNAVFIMAGGFGTRLRPLTDNCPKPMLPVGNKPMLELLIERLSMQGFSDFYLSTHYLPHIIKNYFGDGSRWNVSIRYVHEDSPLGTAGALGLIQDSAPNAPMLMLNGDVLTDLDFTKLLDFHIQNDYDATMCLRESEHQISYGVVDTDGGVVTGMREKPTYIHDINTGIYIVSNNCILGIEPGEKIDMPTYLEKRICIGNTVGAMRHPGYWLDIGRMTDYQKAQRDVLEIFNN